MENEKKLGHKAMHLSIAQIMTSILALLSSMLLSRFRTVKEFGTYSTLNIVITLAISLFMLGLPNSTNYFLAKAQKNEERKEFLSVYYTLTAFIAFVMGMVLVAAIPLIEQYFQNHDICSFWFYLAFYPFAKITISSIGHVLVVYNKTKRLLFINILTASITLCSILIVKLFELTFYDYVVIFLCGNLIIAIFIYYYVSKLENGFSPRFNKKLIKMIFSYSIPIGLATLVSTINIEMDKLMIGRLLGTESLAYYTNAGRELPLTFIASSLTAVVLPQIVKKISNNDNTNAIRLWGTAVKISYTFLCFCVTACVVFAPQIITILYSTKYLAGVQVFRVYALVLLLRTTYFGMILSAVGKTKYILSSSIISLLTNVILNYLFFLLFGFVGPAIASFISIFVIAIFQLVMTCKEIKISIKRILPWKSLVFISLINALWGILAAGIVYILKLGVDLSDIAKAIIIGFVFMVIYGIGFRKKFIILWRDINSER